MNNKSQKEIKKAILKKKMLENKQKEIEKKIISDAIQNKDKIEKRCKRIEKYISDIDKSIDDYINGNKGIKHFKKKEIEHKNSIKGKLKKAEELKLKLEDLKSNNEKLSKHNLRYQKSLNIKKQKKENKETDLKSYKASLKNETSVNKKKELELKISLTEAEIQNMDIEIENFNESQEIKKNNIIERKNKAIKTLENKISNSLKKAEDMKEWVEGAIYNYKMKEDKVQELNIKKDEYVKELDEHKSNIEKVKNVKNDKTLSSKISNKKDKMKGVQNAI